MTVAERASLPPQIIGLAILTLTLIVASAAWIERDAYRFAGLALFLYGAVCRFRDKPRKPFGWMELLCFAWGAWVAARMAVAYWMSGDYGLGSSEGIYLFPVAYSMIGYAWMRQPGALADASWIFVLISLAVVLMTVPFLTVMDGERHDFLVTKNTIHSSVCGGLLILAALNFAGFLWRTKVFRWRTLWLGAAYLTVFACALGIYGAKSKGVWLALGIAIIVQLLVSRAGKRHLPGHVLGAAMLAALCVFVLVDRQDIWASIGPSVDATVRLVEDAFRLSSALGAMQNAVASGTVPFSMNERLMLWTNAVEVWSQAPLLGNGIAWEALFEHARYPDVRFNLLHNGYLEVGVRYGLLGIAFYAALFGWSLVQSRRAWQAGLIAPQAYALHLASLVFFLATLLTNSNNRLAFGEAYMMAIAAFGFYCHFRLPGIGRAQDASFPMAGMATTTAQITGGTTKQKSR